MSGFVLRLPTMSGEHTWIDADRVVAVTGATAPGEDTDHPGTMILLASGHTVWTSEPAADIVALLGWHPTNTAPR